MGAKMCIKVSFYIILVKNMTSGRLRVFMGLHNFRNGEIKNTGLIHCFCTLREIFSGILLVRT